MPTFLCKARDPDGRVIEERIEAPAPKDAAEHLERKGYLPVSVVRLEGPAVVMDPDAKLPRPFLAFLRRPPARQMVLATRQLATLVRAGVVVHTALETVAEECEHPALRQALLQITQDVVRGSSLAKAMARHPHIFDKTYVNAIEAGQLGGKLDLVLTRLASTQEVALKRRQAVKSALRYPVIVLVAFFAAFFFLIRFVVPKFESLFGKFNTQLPTSTRLLLAMHEAITTYAPLTALALLALAVIFVLSYIWAPSRMLWDRLKLRAPVFGPLFLKSGVSSFVQTFNTLNESGVPILHNLEVSGEATGNKVLERAVQATRTGVEKGEPLSKLLRENPPLPPLVAQMFAVGEKSGRMAEVLDPLVAHYDAEVQQAVEGLTAAIEPMLTILIGGLILFLALGIFQPMWQFFRVVQEKA